MRFDSTRVMATVEGLREPRFAGVDGREQLSGLAAERLAEAGWRVEWIGGEADSRLRRPSLESLIARAPREKPAPCRILIHARLNRLMVDDPSSRLGGLVKGLFRRETSVDPDASNPHDLSAIAMLLELARSWPRSWFDRAELILAATGGGSEPFADAATIARRFDPVSTGIPTLLLSVFGPGVGRELAIVSPRHEDLAGSCAKSLWLPVAPSPSLSLQRRLWPDSTVQSFPDRIALIGAGLLEMTPPPLDADALQRAAQLVAEIALRWSKRSNDAAIQAGP